MRLRAEQFLGRIATSLMLLAVAAFVQQGAMIVASQVAAFSGAMPQPAVVIAGTVHLHDNLAGHVHSHTGDNAAGHVHHHADHDDHDADETGKTLLWSLAGTSAVMPMIEACAVSFALSDLIRGRPQSRLDGVEPDGLSRPPSTPSIA